MQSIIYKNRVTPYNGKMEGIMKKTLADTAYELLLEKIYNYELPDEDKIVEQQLIEMLGIGRTPVREAIRRLASDGILDLTPGTFAKVHNFTDKEKQDVGLIRLAIDTVAAPLVVLNGSNRDFQDLMAITTKCQEAYDNNDIMGRIKLDYQFHNTLVAISGNNELSKIQDQLTTRGILMQIQSYRTKGDSFCHLTGHLDIIRCLNERDTSGCIAAMQKHLAHSYASTPENAQAWKSAELALNMLPANA